jgi:hypothetical protein
VDNNYLDLGMNKSGFVHTLPSGRLSSGPPVQGHLARIASGRMPGHGRVADGDEEPTHWWRVTTTLHNLARALAWPRPEGRGEWR